MLLVCATTYLIKKFRLKAKKIPMATGFTRKYKVSCTGCSPFTRGYYV